jgi:hypothetical protein
VASPPTSISLDPGLISLDSGLFFMLSGGGKRKRGGKQHGRRQAARQMRQQVGARRASRCGRCSVEQARLRWRGIRCVEAGTH